MASSPGFTTVNPLDDPGWDQRVIASGSTCFFHSRAWAQVLNQCYGFKPAYLARLRDDQFEVLAPMMEVQTRLTCRKGVALPYSDACDWLVPANASEDTLAAAHAHGGQRQWRYLEIRNNACQPADAPASASHWHHELDLARTQKAAWQALRSEVRTATRKSQKEGIDVRFSPNIDDLREFFRLHTLCRQKLGVPPQSWKFFALIHQHIITAGLGEVGLAYKEDINVAAAVFFFFGGTALYKYAAADPGQLALRGNNALMWAALNRYAQRGFTRLSLGRTDRADTGLRHFKLGWGCRESPLDYYKYDYGLKRFMPPGSGSVRWVRTLLAKTPLPLLKMAGILIYPHRF